MKACLECGTPTRDGARCATCRPIDARSIYNSLEYQAQRRVLLSMHDTCAHCQEPARPGDPLEIDHDPPLAHTVGGEWHGQLIVAHQSCNRSRGATTRSDARRVELDAATRPGGRKNRDSIAALK